jgi:RP/EB family microtubule-associated protein
MGASNIGMMDAAYFVGRNEILAWVNSTLHLALSKVEEVGSRNPHNPYEFSLTSLVN